MAGKLAEAETGASGGQALTRIIDEVKGVDRVVYAVTGKPLGRVEREQESSVVWHLSDGNKWKRGA